MFPDDSSAQTYSSAYQGVEFIATSTCTGTRSNNQDSFFMGGASLGEPLSDLDLENVFSETNHAVKAALKQHDIQDTEENKESGCTALLGIVREKEIVIANAGDCRAILVYKKNDIYEIKRLSSEHRLSNAKEEERISAGFHTPSLPRRLRAKATDKSGIIPTRGLGGENYQVNFSDKPEIERFNISDIDKKAAFIISSTDGFWEAVTDQEVLDFFNKENENHKTLADKANALRQKAYQQKKQHEIDNITVCVGCIHPGMMFGIFDGFGTFGHIAAQTAAQSMHVNLHLKIDIALIQKTLCMPEKSVAEKMQIVQDFYHKWVSLPWWKEYKHLIIFTVCFSLSVLIGGLFTGPLILPALLLSVKKAAILEGAIMGIGAGLVQASLYGAYHWNRYHRSSFQILEEAKHDAIAYSAPCCS